MKITNIRSWVVKIPWDDNPGTGVVRVPIKRAFIFVQVETDADITGWGEVTTYPGPVANRAVAAYIDQIGSWLCGENPENIEAIWHKIFRSLTYVGTRGASTAAISAIDIALWDIRGKVLGLPIYQLLGGPVRESIAMYCHPYKPFSPDDITAAVKEIVASGFQAFKMDPMLHNLHVGNASYLDGEIAPHAEAAALEILAAAREAAGPGVEIMIDAHGLYNVPTAVRLANKMAEYKIHWFEEPVPPESWKALKQVKEQVATPICTGERLHTRWEFVPIFENGLADFVMPDVTWTGGISELKKIATMAEAYYIPISPHDASGPVNVMAGAQVMMTVPNFYKLEVHRYDLSSYNILLDHPLDVRKGHLFVPDRPGLGIELNVDVLKEYEASLDDTANSLR
ncbi:MAG TPA: mandelate racemase/muconate lactonizing enzyme family protein [Caldilineaceae bacterium]|nr:mandelate racemase/muconate lactonizing enzyme family protein [Caldilineaceae bacterium]